MKKTLAAITAFFNKNEDVIENYALIGGLAASVFFIILWSGNF